MAAVNAGIIAAGSLLRRTAGYDAYLPFEDALFFLLLLTLIITMYDRYRVIGNLSPTQPPHGAPRAQRRRFDRHGSPEAPA